jgi:two-component system, OmpR family, phosphate regulon response regulator OmpR
MTVAERHLLVVDDDDRIRGLLKEYLARQGFRVTTAHDAAAATRLMEMLDFDLAVVDVMMPNEDGLSFTNRLRAGAGANAQIPVLMLTARSDADARIEGLSVGADDYLAKPFEPQELLLRIEAILRRAGPKADARRLPLGRCAFDVARGQLECDGTGRAGIGFDLAPQAGDLDVHSPAPPTKPWIARSSARATPTGQGARWTSRSPA